MADLFHLLDELDEPQQQEEEEDAEVEAAVDSAEAAQPPNQEADASDEEESTVDREMVDLPAGLARGAPPPPTTVDNDDEQYDDRLDLQDFAARGEGQGHEEYGRLQHWWIQELQAPEVLPWDGTMLEPLLEAAFDEEDTTAGSTVTTTNNLEAILSDIRRADKERVQYIVANLLQARLHKIQKYPWFYLNHKDRLSQAEVLFLTDFHSLLEKHLETTVTEHFPQEAWRRLDEPEMIEQPDVDQYVMVRALEDCTLRKGTENAYPLEAGSDLVVNYEEIRDFLHAGAVQLIM